MIPAVRLDHLVIAVSDWERSNAFYRDVLGAEVVPRGPVVAYRFGDRQLNVHGPGFEAHPQPVQPVAPGNSDIPFSPTVWTADASGRLAVTSTHDSPGTFENWFVDAATSLASNHVVSVVQ